MTRGAQPETLVERDWGDIWESLPEAPPLVPRGKTTQLTLRMPASTLGRLKAVARARSLAYHALARAWIADALRSAGPPMTALVRDERQSAQLNLKVEQELLDAFKRKASELQRPYHTLARQFIETAVEREEKELGIGVSSRPRLSHRT